MKLNYPARTLPYLTPLPRPRVVTSSTLPRIAEVGVARGDEDRAEQLRAGPLEEPHARNGAAAVANQDRAAIARALALQEGHPHLLPGSEGIREAAADDLAEPAGGTELVGRPAIPVGSVDRRAAIAGCNH